VSLLELTGRFFLTRKYSNGYAVFENMRIPRTNMLMGESLLAEDGTYTKGPESRSQYATMLYGRLAISNVAVHQLAQAVTIATRYSVVREQGLGSRGLPGAEVTIISYKSQHYRLLTLLASAYAILFSSKTCSAEYHMLIKEQGKGIQTRLAYNHHLLSGMKAWCTQFAADGAEDARKCLGGHGYMMISDIPSIVNHLVAACTFEGDNYVMWQQTGRYLMKCMDKLHTISTGISNIDEKMAYLIEAVNQPCSFNKVLDKQLVGKDFLNSELQLEVFRHRAASMIMKGHAELRSAGNNGFSAADAWNKTMMTIIYASRAHIEYFILQSFITHVNTVSNPAIQDVLDRMRSLFALALITNPLTTNGISFIEHGGLNNVHLAEIRDCVNQLLEELLPDAIALTDAWDFTDASLCSAWGMKDGNAYETLMNWVKQEPINIKAANNGGIYKPRWEPWAKAKL
jgi:acyl-CoA oxidase